MMVARLWHRVRLWLYFVRHGYSAQAHGMTAWEFVGRVGGRRQGQARGVSPAASLSTGGGVGGFKHHA